MGAMTTRLQMLASEPGNYEGRSANFSGSGFADMYFLVHAVPPDQFDAWAAKTKSGGPTLDQQSYEELAKPSEAVTPFTYAAVSPGLFEHADRQHAADRLYPRGRARRRLKHGGSGVAFTRQTELERDPDPRAGGDGRVRPDDRRNGRGTVVDHACAAIGPICGANG